uniref:Uncharacterized protein n=1 Tax=viral metagenome TaxID=1070528 RepID=A0A6C0LT33_9ZZZZ
MDTECTSLCKKQPLTLGLKIVFAIITIFCMYLFTSWVQTNFKFKSTTDWFKTYTTDNYQPIINGVTQSVPYKERINLFNMYAAYDDKLMYIVSSLFVPPVTQVSVNAQQFIFSDILKYSTYVDTGSVNTYGCVTPYALVESIKPTYGVGDQIFDWWCNKNEDFRKDPTHTNKSFGPDFSAYSGERFVDYYKDVNAVPLSIDWSPNNNDGGSSPSSTDDDKNSIWQPAKQYIAVKKALETHMGKFNDNGVYDGRTPMPYPSDTDTMSWRNLFLIWLGPKWCIESVDDGSSSFYLLNSHNYNQDDDAGKPKGEMGTLSDKYGWYGDKDTTSNPANFMARMNIGPQSPLFVYFTNGTFSVNGMYVDANAFQNCLSSHGRLPGGWVGFAQGMGKDTSVDDFTNYVRSRVDYQEEALAVSPKKCSAGKKAGSGAMSFFQSFVPALTMLAFIPGADVLAGPGLAIMAGAVITGSLSAANDECVP